MTKKKLKTSTYFGKFLRLFLRGSLSPTSEGGIDSGNESGVANTVAGKSEGTHGPYNIVMVSRRASRPQRPGSVRSRTHD